MSRLTSAQIIGLGEYLDTNFDPASLTVSQLLGVFGYHNIRYPTPYTKPKLIQIFNDEIKGKAVALRKERLKKENSQASDEGIIDGITGRPIREEKGVATRRSSRRVSRVTSEEKSPTRPEPPKRRRSSAQPTLGGPSVKKLIISDPSVLEESEPEEEQYVARKVRRNTKNEEDAGSHSRRISAISEDSGWEDNNIFQSGAESSSPVRPPTLRSRAVRKSTTSRKSRKASSAPPQLSPPSSPLSPAILHRSPPKSTFKPEFPPDISVEVRRLHDAQSRPHAIDSVVAQQEDQEYDADTKADRINLVDSDTVDDSVPASAGILEESVTQEEDAVLQQDDQSQVDAITRRIAEGGQGLLRTPPARNRESTLTWLKSFCWLISALFAAAIVKYKVESQAIGFCDTGTNANKALQEQRAYRQAIEACNLENRTSLYSPSVSGELDETPCPPLELIFLHPDTCTLCSEHAICTQHTITCDHGYILRSHPLLGLLPAVPYTASSVPFFLTLSSPAEFVWKVISEATDGLPGFGSVAFPPKCVEDPVRRRHIGALGKATEAMLGRIRGRKLCEARSPAVHNDSEGGEARTWGIALNDLYDAMVKKTPDRLKESFDSTFDEAIQQLVQWGGVLLGEDSTGRRYVAHKTPDLTWDCILVIKARDVWAQWKSTAIGILLFAISAYIVKAQAANRRIENKRVAELVQIALDTLRNQELAHYTDPVTAPQPYLSSLQLRDLILQDEHSLSTRRRLWDKVERVVEGNTNVRANLEEVHGGDELRVWRWVGGTGGGPTLRKRVQIDGKEGGDGNVA